MSVILLVLDYTSFWYLSEQPTTCFKCGSRTDFDCFMHTNAKWQIHYCLDEVCGNIFFACEDDFEDE